MNNTTTTQALLAGVLRAAVVLTLVGAGWSIYRRLPRDVDAQTADTRLRILLRREPDRTPTPEGDVTVQLYSINVAAAQREYLAERPVGVSLQDFMARRMQGRPVIETRLDERGEANVVVASGTWWVHAVRDTGAEEVTWRLRVNVAGREQTVELKPDNAYTRAKRF